jgi:Fe-S-cluster containining protein
MPNQEQLKELAENIGKMEIGLDDTFRFKCHGCGKCCKNREDILLNARDLFNLARYLKMKPEGVVRKYCESYIGTSSKIPIVRLRPIGVNKLCPFLRDNGCEVHAAKPSVCALYPLGRFAKTPNNEIGVTPGDKLEIGFLLMPVECGGHRSNTVRGWLESFGIPIDDPFFALWYESVINLGTYIRKLEKQKIPTAAFNAVWTVAYRCLYLEYDIKQDFMPQFQSKLVRMKTTLDILERKAIQPFLKGEMPDEP